MLAILLLFFAFIAAEILICSAPARLPIVRQRAMTNCVWRWSAILLLSLIPTYINYAGSVWVVSDFDVFYTFDLMPYGYGRCSSAESDCENGRDAFGHILNDRGEGELVNEITLRRLFFSGEEHCFSNNSTVCEAATYWLRVEKEREKRADDSASWRIGDYVWLFIAIVIFLSPSFLTGFFVHRITRDNRKQKRS